tara:strand:+ start:1497 stop:1955 length:459 start_codon:yes stop_codon:yes gene_type:complete
MSQGIFSALSHLENEIMSIVPKSDIHHGFVCLARADGLVSSLDQRFNSTRYFTLMIEGYPEDDGAAGLSGRRRARVSCEVRYDIPKDEIYLSRMISEDAEYILEKLKGPNYDLATTGIISVIPEPPIYQVIDQTTNTGHLLTVPFTLLYLEA